MNSKQTGGKMGKKKKNMSKRRKVAEGIVEPESIMKARKAMRETPLESRIEKVKEGIKELTGKEGTVENLREAEERAEKITDKLYEQGKIDKVTRNELKVGSGEEQVIRTAEVMKALKGKRRKEEG